MASAYVGKPGCGKSTLLRGHVAILAAQPDAPIFLVNDHDDSWPYPHLTNVADWHRFRYPVTAFRGVSGKEIATLAIRLGNACYVDDESDVVTSDGPWLKNPLREIVKRGRHLRNVAGRICEVNAMLATQRPANLPTDIGSCLETIYIGKLDAFIDAERVFREGWIPEARNAYEAQAILTRLRSGKHDGVADFRMYPE